jgi:hypothetical protein
MNGRACRFTLRGSTPLALAALSAGCLAVLMAGPVTAATAHPRGRQLGT